MPYRLVEIHLPASQADRIDGLISGQEEGSVVESWSEITASGKSLSRVLLLTDKTSEFMDLLESAFSDTDSFRVILLPVLASLPRPVEKEKEEEEEKEEEKSESAGNRTSRISREELYANVTGMVDFSPIYFILVILSTVVAVIGLIKSSVATIIGAMVIAPLVGPNVALSLATTLCDAKLFRRALRVNLVGIATALFVSLLIGFLFPVRSDIPEIAARLRVDFGDIGLALAAGAAGALSLTAGIPTMLVGVMVAVALLPPTVTMGLMIGGGNFHQATNAMMLLLANVFSLNLAGVATFLFQEIRPLGWWEAEKAKRSTMAALLVWALLLGVLVVVILISQKRSAP